MQQAKEILNHLLNCMNCCRAVHTLTGPWNVACMLLLVKQDIFRMAWAFCHIVPAKVAELCVWNVR